MLRGGFAFEKDGLFLQNNLSIYKGKKYNIRKYTCVSGNRKYEMGYAGGNKQDEKII